MTQTDASNPNAGKGKPFFDRADQVASTGNWDFAIEMYLEGIIREPENMERGHRPLREVALKRKAGGGKGPGMMETFKLGAGKDPIQNLRNAEYLLAKEPGSTAYMERVYQAASKLDLKSVAKWILDILYEAQKLANKPDKRLLLSLAKAYDQLEEYQSSVVVLRMAVEASPKDATLQDALREQEAKSTIKQGGYDNKEGGFAHSVKDMNKQNELMEKDKLVQSKSFVELQIERTRGEYEGSPTVPGKVNGYVEALLKVEDESTENLAIDVLAKAHKDTGAYQFKMKMGDVKIRQAKRLINKQLQAGDKKNAAAAAQKLLEFELAEYIERAQNYPTDLGIKYELGRRQLASGKLDEAIASFQQAKRDPRRQILAILHLGQAFTKKGWFREASDTYEQALKMEIPSEERRKELLYSLADAKEQMGRGENSKELLQAAQDIYSQVAQLDFNYKDVRERLEKLRAEVE
ncbi:MAG: hypothetical protein EHM48_02285 [Planctomycetaceae bacterium]|nr:MAG: hypothetical protein EHM48_02285 [Planctomycetaceae bacterium]